VTHISEAALKDILKRNPDLRTHEAVEAPRRAIPADVGSDKLAAQFEALWALLGGSQLEREYRFHPTRKWRFDYAHLGAKVAIELNGGVWSGGRHVRGAGYLRDREKVNAAQIMGWRVFEIGTGAVTAANLEPIIDAIKRYPPRGEE
jgi:very-short-patch-repair endonuclease